MKKNAESYSWFMKVAKVSSELAVLINYSWDVACARSNREVINKQIWKNFKRSIFSSDC